MQANIASIEAVLVNALDYLETEMACRNRDPLTSRGGGEAVAEQILKMVTRLAKVAKSCTAMSFGLHLGANTILRETSLAMIMDAAKSSKVIGWTVLMTVIWLYALLDGDDKKVSFQSVYRQLKKPSVVEAMVARIIALPVVFDQDREEKAARAAINRFITLYNGIDWKTHGSLVHFRNIGIAHLTPQELQRPISYSELEHLVRTVVAMAEALVFFV